MYPHIKYAVWKGAANYLCVNRLYGALANPPEYFEQEDMEQLQFLEELLEEVLEKHPDDLSANLALASLLQKAEDTQEAKRYLQNVLFYYPENQTAKNRLKRLEK